MKLSLLALAISLAASAAASAQELPVRPEQLPPSPPPSYSPPAPVVKTLSNGLTVTLLPDHALPLVQLTALVPAGSVHDPADRVGLARLAGACLAAGGTRNHPAATLQDTLESLAAQVTSSAGLERTTVTVDVLAKDLDTVLPVYAEILSAPAFEAGPVSVEKAKLAETLRRENQDPVALALREIKKRLYGADSPWARTPTAQGIAALGPDDLREFHRRLFHPETIRLAVSGDFETAGMLRRLERAFGAWRPPHAAPPEVAAAPAAPAPGVFLMDRPDLTQTTVLVGTLIGPRGRGASFNRDVYAMDVANFLLGGGGANSRLTREIRSNRGLAYGAESAYQFGTSRGWFLAFTQTAPETTVQAVAIILSEFERAVSHPPSEEEVALAKESLARNFVFRFRSPAQIAETAASQAEEGYPPDYLDTYLKRIRALTPADCQTVMKKALRREGLTVFVLGPAEKLKEPLAAFGDVVVSPVPEP